MKFVKYAEMTGKIRISVPVIHEAPKTIPLEPVQTLVYGILVYRSRKKKSMTKTEIGKFLRLDREAVHRAVESLCGIKVVQRVDKRLVAVEPAGEARQFFRFRRDARGEWQSSFVFDRVFLPCSSRTLSVKTNALFWHLYKLGVTVAGMPGYLQVGGHPDAPVQYVNKKYLAKALRCHRTTISNGLNRLVKLGLITVHRLEWGRLVVGIPPLSNNVQLWRDEIQKAATQVSVTAQQLFGVPSSAPVKPVMEPKDGMQAALTACRIPPRLAEQIAELIRTHEIPPAEWKDMLNRAKSKHSDNMTKHPRPVAHCGYLFQKMLQDWGQAEVARQALTSPWTPPSYEEVCAKDAMLTMRFTGEAEQLLRYAILEDSLKLADGRCVPCPLTWDRVGEIAKKVKNDFNSFKDEIARFIFTFEEGRPPNCKWFDRWMAAPQIPLENNQPLQAQGLGSWDAREARHRINDWIDMFVDGTVERVEYGNTFVWLASLQVKQKTPTSVKDALELLARQVRELEPETFDEALDGVTTLGFR